MASKTPKKDYRDHIATVDESGKRVWIYPKKPKGPLYKARTYVSWGCLALLFLLPFIKVNGEPLLLFNVLELKFILFGVLFTPQDLHLFALAMITFMVFIVLFTVVFGRLFCGWVCPQTIFMEMVFRKIEYWIEGDYNQQRRLDKAPWTKEKLIKKGSKHGIFFLISVVIANTFLAYIIGIDEVLKITTEPVSQHLIGFVAMLVFSSVFYFVFARFREQVCTVVCPYGRLQGVLLTQESIVVAYDYERGEPRGKIRKNRKKELDPLQQIEAAVQGDCIACNLCVKVCPTGIDIRNGTQMECVNCTACIDACDEVMEKVGRPKKLIRYDSDLGIREGNKKLITPRVLAYSGVLLVLVIVQIVLFSLRTDVETIVLRTPGMLYQKVDDTYISNLYNYQVVNKTTEDIDSLSFRLKTEDGRLNPVGKVPPAPTQAMAEGAFFIEMNKHKLQGYKTKLWIEVYAGDKLIDEVKTNFLGPPR